MAVAIIRTYLVTVTHPDGTTAEARVNLTYNGTTDYEAVDNAGRVVEEGSIQATAEVLNRLRRLARKGKVPVTNRQLDESTDLTVQVVRRKMVDA